MSASGPTDSRPAQWHTIVDVLDNALDGEVTEARAERLTMREVADLREAVLVFYDAWASYPPSEGLLRVHLGGWVASAANEGPARDLLTASLLYAHEVVVYDPVAAYFEPHAGRLRDFRTVVGQGLDLKATSIHVEKTSGFEYRPTDLAAHRSHLARAFRVLGAIAPLIREGVAVPIPHLRLTLQRQDRIWSAVRRLLLDQYWRDLVDHPLDRPAITQDQGPGILFLTDPRTRQDQLIQQYGDAAYYLARALAMADVAYAQYVPPSRTEWAIYEQRLKAVAPHMRRSEKLELRVLPALFSSALPYFHDLPWTDLVAARANEDAFNSWRSKLRSATRTLASIPADDGFEDEARTVLEDALHDAAVRAYRASSASGALGRYLRPAGLSIAAGAAGVMATGALTQEPIAPALAGTATTGIVRWLADSLLGAAHPRNAAGVIAHLQHAGPLQTEEGWPTREGLVIRPKHRAAARRERARLGT